MGTHPGGGNQGNMERQHHGCMWGTWGCGDPVDMEGTQWGHALGGT